jgi:hypothetical protein
MSETTIDSVGHRLSCRNIRTKIYWVTFLCGMASSDAQGLERVLGRSTDVAQVHRSSDPSLGSYADEGSYPVRIKLPLANLLLCCINKKND